MFVLVCVGTCIFVRAFLGRHIVDFLLVREGWCAHFGG